MRGSKAKAIREQVAMDSFPPENEQVYSKADRREIFKDSDVRKMYRAGKKNYKTKKQEKAIQFEFIDKPRYKDMNVLAAVNHGYLTDKRGTVLIKRRYRTKNTNAEKAKKDGSLRHSKRKTAIQNSMQRHNRRKNRTK